MDSSSPIGISRRFELKTVTLTLQTFAFHELKLQNTV